MPQYDLISKVLAKQFRQTVNDYYWACINFNYIVWPIIPQTFVTLPHSQSTFERSCLYLTHSEDRLGIKEELKLYIWNRGMG